MLYTRVTLSLDADPGQSIRLHPDALDALGLANRRYVEVHLGQSIAPCEAIPDSTIERGVCVLGGESAGALHVSHPMDLELRPVTGGVVMGPSIGCLIGTGEGAEGAKSLLPRLLAYRSLRGQVLAFDVEGIHPGVGYVEGFVYSPRDHAFQPGRAPIPTALYLLPGAVTAEDLMALRQTFGEGILNLPLPPGADCLGAMKGRPSLREALERGDNGGEIGQFSLYLQRDQSTFFRLNAFLGRDPSDVDTPLLDGPTYLSQSLRNTQERTFVLQERMTHLALEVTSVLQTLVPAIAEVVVDIGLMADGSLRLKGLPRALKVPEVALALGDGILYHRLLSTPLFYAKAKAGYPFASS